MNDTELLKFSDKQRLVATEILSESGLMNTLMKHGECTAIGSYKYDLMYGPDIDLVVKTDNPREASLKAVKELIDARQFQKYQYGDFEKYPRDGRPRAFIIVLILNVAGVKWETEVWFQRQFTEDQIYFGMLMKEKLTPENRLTILKLKQERDNNIDDKHRIKSTEIYKAVLMDGETNYTKILAKLSQK